MLNTKEHAELVEMFERVYRVRGCYAEKEPKHLQIKGNVYCSGSINQMFIAYRDGYAFGKAKWQTTEGTT